MARETGLPTITDRRAIEVTAGEGEATQRLGWAVEGLQKEGLRWFAFSTAGDIEGGAVAYLGEFRSAAKAYRAIVDHEEGTA